MPLAPAELMRRAAALRCLFLDVDGVMTDGKLYLSADGSELKTVSVRDGLGIKQLLQRGIEIAVISGRPSPAMQQRLEYLGVQHVHLATEDKLPAFEAVCRKLGIDDAECAHMGDDTPDLPLFARVGLALTVADAHPRALAAADWVSSLGGGNGAIREASDLIMQAKGWM